MLASNHRDKRAEIEMSTLLLCGLVVVVLVGLLVVLSRALKLEQASVVSALSATSRIYVLAPICNTGKC